MGEAIRWVACIAVGGLFGLFLIGNWLLLLGTARTKKPTSLVFPFISGPGCALACWLSPSPFLQEWFWVPLALDFSLLVLIGIGVARIGRLFRRAGAVGASQDAEQNAAADRPRE